jgi:hypothetical protein
MYAGQWIADQAAQRQMSLARGQGGVQIGVEHAKLLDTLSAMGQGMRLPGMLKPEDMRWGGGGGMPQQQPGQQQPGQQHVTRPLQ